MLSSDQLFKVMSTSHDVYLTFGMGDEWAKFHSILDKGIITLEVQDFNYTPMYYLWANLSTTPLIDSPVYHSSAPIVSQYYLHQTNRLIKFLRGLMSPLEMKDMRLTVHTYCKCCHKRLTNYHSMLIGLGPECNK